MNISHRKGYASAGRASPGETKTARFQEVKKGYKGDTFPLKLAIIDEPLEEFVMEKMELPVTDVPGWRRWMRRRATGPPGLRRRSCWCSPVADGRPVA